MKMSNRWNRVVYRLWSPIYDAVFERVFRRGRERAMKVVELQAGESVCFIGVGTGADLRYLPEGVRAVGVDLSEAMLSRARNKLPIRGGDVKLRLGDAQALPLDGASFDAVVLNLVVSVVPDPARCLSEALRVLRPAGRIVVFDKFVPDDRNPSFGRRLLNVVTKLFGTDINRRLGDIAAGLPCAIAHDEPSIFSGVYRVVLLKHTAGAVTSGAL